MNMRQVNLLHDSIGRERAFAVGRCQAMVMERSRCLVITARVARAVSSRRNVVRMPVGNNKIGVERVSVRGVVGYERTGYRADEHREKAKY